MTRFFASINQGRVFLTPVDEHHLKVVLRARPGTVIEVVQEGQLYRATIKKVDPLDIQVLEPLPGFVPRVLLTLIYSLPKGDKLDLVVQKATELGVTSIILVKTERSIARWAPADRNRKLDRLQAIAREASSQSRRLDVPTIEYIDGLGAVLDRPFEVKLIASEYLAGTPPFDLSLQGKNDIAMMVGPEGGFDPREIEAATQAGYRPVSLGRTILRSETAAIAAIAILSYILNHATV
jgi:16S rRNA (uracil1498-N3)-methyltransferase